MISEFTTGFPSIDKQCSLNRGEIYVYVGKAGCGKTSSLIKAISANLHLGKNVLFIILGLDSEDSDEGLIIKKN